MGLKVTESQRRRKAVGVIKWAHIHDRKYVERSDTVRLWQFFSFTRLFTFASVHLLLLSTSQIASIPNKSGGIYTHVESKI